MSRGEYKNFMYPQYLWCLFNSSDHSDVMRRNEPMSYVNTHIIYRKVPKILVACAVMFEANLSLRGNEASTLKILWLCWKSTLVLGISVGFYIWVPSLLSRYTTIWKSTSIHYNQCAILEEVDMLGAVITDKNPPPAYRMTETALYLLLPKLASYCFNNAYHRRIE